MWGRMRFRCRSWRLVILFVLITGEMIRFLLNPNAKKFAGAGQGSSSLVNTSGVADVYATLIFGMNAFGIVPLRGSALTTHLKARGSGGTSDPLDQVGTTGWKAKTTSVILNDNFMQRVESCATV